MTSTATSAATKRGFDFARGNLFNCDPDKDICLIGGAAVLAGHERGELDNADTKHALYDVRLEVGLDDEFIRNIDAFGVITPIQITRLAELGDVAVVVAGRRRVRAARVVNRQRAKVGQPLLKVPCVVRRASEVGLLGAMISENEAREDDTPMARLEKLKRYMERGVPIETAAIAFGVKTDTAKGWLAFDDHAAPELRKLLREDRITFYAAATIARRGDHDAQRAALAEAGATATVAPADPEAPAKKPRRINHSKVIKNVTVRDLRRMLDALREMPHPNANAETLAWWDGVADAFSFALGDGDKPNGRLAKVLADTRKP